MRKLAFGTIAISGCIALGACGTAPSSNEPEAREAVAPVPQEVAVPVALADLTGDAAAGERVFGQCRACHSVEEGDQRAGPTLYGIVGRTAGSMDGFPYSQANLDSGVEFTPEALFEYIESPREFMPGNRMAFPGIKDAQDRADLVAYLGTLGS